MLRFFSTPAEGHRASFRPSGRPVERFLGRCRVCRRGLRLAGVCGVVFATREPALQLADGTLVLTQSTNRRAYVIVDCPVCATAGRLTPIGQPCRIVLSVLSGTYNPDKRCGSACRNATGPDCECRCGGVHHGASHDHPAA